MTTDTKNAAVCALCYDFPCSCGEPDFATAEEANAFYARLDVVSLNARIATLEAKLAEALVVLRQASELLNNACGGVEGTLAPGWHGARDDWREMLRVVMNEPT